MSTTPAALFTSTGTITVLKNLQLFFTFDTHVNFAFTIQFNMSQLKKLLLVLVSYYMYHIPFE